MLTHHNGKIVNASAFGEMHNSVGLVCSFCNFAVTQTAEKQGVKIHARKVSLKINGESINIIVPPVGITGGPASVISPNGVYAR